MAVLQSTGKQTFLRINDVGTGWGAEPNFLDAEVIMVLDSEPDKTFGFTLRNDDNRPAHQAMVDILRDAFINNWNVTIEYDIEPGRTCAMIFRLWLTK